MGPWGRCYWGRGWLPYHLLLHDMLMGFGYTTKVFGKKSRSSMKFPKECEWIQLDSAWFHSSTNFSMCFTSTKSFQINLISYSRKGIIVQFSDGENEFQWQSVICTGSQMLLTREPDNRPFSEFRCWRKRSSRYSPREQNFNICLASGNFVTLVSCLTKMDWTR